MDRSNGSVAGATTIVDGPWSSGKMYLDLEDAPGGTFKSEDTRMNGKRAPVAQQKFGDNFDYMSEKRFLRQDWRRWSVGGVAET